MAVRFQRNLLYRSIMYYHLRALGDNYLWDLLTFPAGLLRCMYVANGIGLFFYPSPAALWSCQLNLNGCTWCWVVHRTISRLKCDCFNTLIHLSLAFRMLQKLPNYSSALYPSWWKSNRDSSTFLLMYNLSVDAIFTLFRIGNNVISGKIIKMLIKVILTPKHTSSEPEFKIV